MLQTRAPYPDEFLSSAITRYSRHHGVPIKRIGAVLLGRTSWCPGFLLPMPLGRLAALFNATSQQLLWEHTPFPYATSFVPLATYERAFITSLTGNEGNSCLGATIQNASTGLSFRRLCPECTRDELAKLGESYWHITHNLPGVVACPTHGVHLHATVVLAKHLSSTPYCMPHEVTGKPLGPGRPGTVAKAVSRIALGLQRRSIGPGEERDGSYYRALAVEHGWLEPTEQVRRAGLESAIRRRFAPGLLASCGLNGFDLSWAACMLRPRVDTPQTTAKHVIMQELLTSSATESTGQLRHRSPGPPRSSAKLLDSFYSRQADAQFKKVLSSGEQLSTEAFLRRAGCWPTYHHRKAELPLLRQVVLRFRASPSSVKPLRQGSILFRTIAGEAV